MNLLNKILALLLALVLVGGTVYVTILKGQINSISRQLDQNLRDRATELGALEAEHRATAELVNSLNSNNSKLLSELRKVRPDVKPVEVADSTASIPKHTVQPDVTQGQTSGTVWHDSHHRFEFDVNLMQLSRKQEFAIQTVVLQSPTGVKLLNQTLVENDPESHRPITDEPPITVRESTFMVDNDTPSVAVFHPRLVAAAGYLGQVGAGVQVANGERFGGLWAHTNLSLLGLYDPREKKADGVVVLGFRPGNLTLSVGPAYFFPKNAFGAAVTIELTR